MLSFLKHKNKNTPPWVKCSNGRMFNDEKDPRYRAFFYDLMKYYSQWKVKDGGLIKKDLGLKKPDWKKYV